MQTLNIHGIDEETLQGFVNLASRAYQYCLRQCGKWGSPTCFSCMFRDIRKLHDKATGKSKSKYRKGIQCDTTDQESPRDAERSSSS